MFMKLLLAILIVAPSALLSQSIESLHQPKMKELHVRTFEAYRIDSGKTQILCTSTYDSLGRITSQKRGTSAVQAPVTEYDTVFYWHENTKYVYGKSYMTDSAISYYGASAEPHRLLTYEYTDGAVSNISTMGGDSTNSYYIMRNHRGNNELTIGTYSLRTYDSLGRVTSYRSFDTTIYAGREFISEESFVETKYQNNLVIERTYYSNNGSRELYCIKFSKSGDQSWDSTIYYNKKGRIARIDVHHRDPNCKWSSTISLTRKGKFISHSSWEQNDSTAISKTYDANGASRIIFIQYYDTKGLIVKETQFFEDREITVFFNYTF